MASLEALEESGPVMVETRPGADERLTSVCPGGWTAPVNPRWTYGGRPLLYKIQVAADLSENEKAGAIDPGMRFLQDFLPALERHLMKL